MISQRALLPLVASLLGSAVAQTFTSCNPMKNTDCPLDTALGIANYSVNFASEGMDSKIWKTTAGTIGQDDSGSQFVINKQGDSPTVQTNFYLFFGQVEVIMRAASGQGIISSIVLESDDLDEVDWEFMGGNNTHVETNYFGKGNTTLYNRATYYPVEDPQQNFHNYTTQWTSDQIEWYIDGTLVRTLAYADADGGYDFPQTPMNVRLGIWAGGDPTEPEGVIEWAGGKTDFSKGPYTMTVQSVRVSDFSRGTQYKYGDTSGSWQSIDKLNTAPALISGDSSNSNSTGSNSDPTNSNSNSTSSSPAQTIENKWHGLSDTSKYIIIGSSIGGTLLLLAALAFCCRRQRHRAARKRRLESEAFEKQRTDGMAYQGESYAQVRAQAQDQQFSQFDHTTSPTAQTSNPMDGARTTTGGYQGLSPQPNYAANAGSFGSRSQASLGSNGGYAQSAHSFTGGQGGGAGYGNAPYGAGGRGYARY